MQQAELEQFPTEHTPEDAQTHRGRGRLAYKQGRELIGKVATCIGLPLLLTLSPTVADAHSRDRSLHQQTSTAVQPSSEGALNLTPLSDPDSVAGGESTYSSAVIIDVANLPASSPKDKWIGGLSEDGSSYIIQVEEKNIDWTGSPIIKIPGEFSKDNSIKVDVILNKGDNGRVMTLGYLDIRAQINLITGVVKVIRGSETLISAHRPDLLKSDGPNTLELGGAKDGKIFFSLGNEVIGTSTNSKLEKGEFYFGLGGGAGEATAVVNNISVQSRESALPLNSARVILSETFDDPDNIQISFPLPGGSDVSQKLIDGELELKNVGEEKTVWGVMIPKVLTDSTISVDARILASNPDGPENQSRDIVISCRESEAGGYLFFLFDKSFNLDRQDGKDRHQLVTGSRGVLAGNVGNHIELSCRRNKITVSLNGQKVAEVIDDTYTKGVHEIGVGERGTVARIDNLKITTP